LFRGKKRKRVPNMPPSGKMVLVDWGNKGGLLISNRLAAGESAYVADGEGESNSGRGIGGSKVEGGRGKRGAKGRFRKKKN